MVDSSNTWKERAFTKILAFSVKKGISSWGGAWKLLKPYVVLVKFIFFTDFFVVLAVVLAKSLSVLVRVLATAFTSAQSSFCVFSM